MRAGILVAGLVTLHSVSITAGIQAQDVDRSPSWYSAEVASSVAVASGDFNGDGLLDIVFANAPSPSQVYLNQGAGFEATASWVDSTGSPGPANTSSVATADYNGDGLTDILFGNNDQVDRLLAGRRSGRFSLIWESPANGTLRTDAVAMADVDGDGSLEVVSLHAGVGIAVYRNSGGLPAEPQWSGGDHQYTCVASGDMDKDGAVDLVCGTADGGILMYLNNGTGFEATHSWASPDTTPVLSVSLGDVDGDGFLDVVGGYSIDNPMQQNGICVYGNPQGSPTATPTWSLLTDYDVSATLADVDGNGTPDIVAGCTGYIPYLDFLNVNRVFLNASGSFSTSTWMSRDGSYTRGTAAVDVDDDGIVELVFANSGANTWHWNHTGPFEAEPHWTAGDDNASTAEILLLDVDGDGYTEIVNRAGSQGDGCRVYPNQDGTFAATASWSATGYIRDLTAGDMDGDGRVDLVAARGYPDNDAGWYRGSGAAFNDVLTPVGSYWHPGGVVAHDLNDDGLTDIAVGTWGGDFVHYNTASGFPASADWTSNLHYYTSSAAVADFNGDGRPDLVFGTTFDEAGDNNVSDLIYWNIGATFESEPWRPADRSWTSKILVGDVGNNGRPDLLCFAAGHLYRNVSGIPNQTPQYFIEGLDAAVLVDVDGDGDLDLLGSDASAGYSVYSNVGGTFDDGQEGVAPTSYLIKSMSAGDVDLDGDPDLALGLDGFDALIRGTRNRSPRGGGYPAPSYHQASNPPGIFAVQVVDNGDYSRDLAFTLKDIESDSASVVVEYKHRGDADWTLADLRSAPALLATSPEGVRHELIWDTASLVPDRREAILRIKAIDRSTRGGPLQVVPAHVLNMGVLGIDRAILAFDDIRVSFPDAVTLGDTVEGTLAITNTGNRPLEIRDIRLPIQEMHHTATLPLIVPPGLGRTVELSLRPRTVTEINGDILLETNDPLTPVGSIRVEADIRGLWAELSSLVDGDVAQLGAPLSIYVSPQESVVIERATLFYRTQGQVDFTSMSMEYLGNTFLGVIAGDDVEEPAIEYYVTVENSGVASVIPPGAPGLFRTQVVESPASVTTIPRPNAGRETFAQVDLSIEVALPQGGVFSAGTLHYRPGGGGEYRSATLVQDGSAIVGTIPAEFVGSRGIEYWVSVTTPTAILTEPPVDASGSPLTVQVAVADLADPVGCAARRYRMVSVPLAFDPSLSLTLEDLVSDQQEFGPYNDTNWRSFRYDPDLGQYAELEDGSPLFELAPGRGYWLVTAETGRIRTAPVVGVSVPTGSPVDIELQPGWNQIGSPFEFAVDWWDCQVDQVPAGDVADGPVSGPVDYTSSGYDYEVTRLEPWHGYWIHNGSDRVAILSVPAAESVTTDKEADRPGVHWSVTIAARGDDRNGPRCVLGSAGQARDGRDAYDRPSAPLAPDSSLDLYLVSEGGTREPRRLAFDFRAPPEDGQSAGWAWDLAIDGCDDREGHSVELELEDAHSLPDSFSVLLVDRTLMRTHDLRVSGTYDFPYRGSGGAGSSSGSRFAVIVGTEDAVMRLQDGMVDLPARTALRQNRPNPFNAATMIRFEVDRAGSAEVRIYDLGGALVRTLFSGEVRRGGAEFLWRGLDDRGQRVASGVYICRLTTSWGEQESRKMMLVQ